MQEWIIEAEGFEWDKYNTAKIKAKHKVDVYECEEVFFNELFVSYDEGHSQAEQRYWALGRTNAERLLFVVFTLRNKNIRVISARDMDRKERRIYEERIKEGS